MRVVLLLSLMTLATGCSRDQQNDRDPWEETLIGEVVAIDGRPQTSGFRVTFFTTDDDAAAERYRIDSPCMDQGYFDPRHGRFLSDTSPIGTGADKSTDQMRRYNADRKVGACGPDQHVYFERIIRIMQEGTALTEDGAGGARLTTPSGRSIDLIISPRI